MKSDEGIMEILEAFDLTGSFRSAAELAGCSHHTVEHYVGLRDAGGLPTGGEPVQRAKLIDPHLAKVEEWVERSHGRIRADVVADKLEPLGFEGSERTVRRAVAAVKANYRAGRRRVYRPWIPEPGMWAQWDWGQGPRVADRITSLFCAWLAWCRFRVVIPTWDRTLPTLIGCLDRAMRIYGGCPTYWLTDNERTVTTDHVAGMAVRHPLIVQVGRHYGVTVATCVPADPESKGGSEATVRVAKADLVPTEANLLDGYESWAELVAACEVFTAEVNARVHRVTRRPPVEMLAEEQARLHRLPETPFTAAFGQTRKVSWSATISYGGVIYSVPHQLIDAEVWVRVDGAAGFPTGKTFDTWDETVSSIPAPTQRSLATLEWIDRHENLVVCGPSGTGKSHLLEALGHAAIDHGCHVQWFSLEALGALVHRHRADGTTSRAIRKLMRADLTCIDDIGLLPVSNDTAEALYRTVDAAYERRSIALSSNLHPAGFDELMPKSIANATVDRLMHHAHVVITTGDSIRLTQATRGKGVRPLTN